MKGLHGIQGLVYVGTGCVFRRQALYGYEPPVKDKKVCVVAAAFYNGAVVLVRIPKSPSLGRILK
jgi:hypothetical protein